MLDVAPSTLAANRHRLSVGFRKAKTPLQPMERLYINFLDYGDIVGQRWCMMFIKAGHSLQVAQEP